MLIKELLLETSNENQDINRVANFLASNIVKYLHKMSRVKKVEYFTLSSIERILKIPLPNISSPYVKLLLTDEVIYQITDKISLAAISYVPGKYNPNLICVLMINIEKLSNQVEIELALVHEMQHAVDYIKSQARGFPSTNINPIDLGKDEYDRHPKEINARFAEVLYMLSKFNNIDKKSFVALINFLFKDLKLTVDLWPPGDPRAQKIINRLKSRAYKFYNEVLLTIPTDKKVKKNWITTIKNLIKKFIAANQD